MKEGDISQEKEVKEGDLRQEEAKDPVEGKGTQEGIGEGNKQVCYLRIHLKKNFFKGALLLRK